MSLPVLVLAAVLLVSALGLAPYARRRTQRATPPAIDTQPGHDTDLLLACIEAWDDPDGYRRLRNAINQHRKENEQ